LKKMVCICDIFYISLAQLTYSLQFKYEWKMEL
jgi:hypothetical protein